jgi:cation diffusion facilitator family transporter
MEYSSASNREKTSVALSSVSAAIVVTALKIVIGVWTGSLGILSEAAHSSLDLVAAVITFLAVRFSARPADKTHLYGHGKIESFSALIETILLFGTCAWIITEAVKRLMFHSVKIEVTFWSFFVMIVSIVVDYSRSRALYRVARKHKSQALEADALHFSSDIWSSSVVLLGLVLAAFRIPVADSIAALIVALIVVFVTLSLGKRTIDELLDRAPSGMEDRIAKTALGVDGVQNVDNIRVRNSGSKMFVDLTLYLKRTLPFELADSLVHTVEKLLHDVIPHADILIHPEPVATEDETVADKIKLMMQRDGLIAHNVRAFRVNGQYKVEFHVEFGTKEKFVQIHSIADEIEARIKKEIPDVSSVVIHLEDIKERIVDSVDVTISSQKLIERVVHIAMSHPRVRKCSVVSVLDVGKKYCVLMKCVVDKNLALEEVHAVSTAVESKIMVEIPRIAEVTIHTEPSTK